MDIAAVSLRNFRSHRRFQVELASGLTVLAGPNGSGKTNVLEAIHFGLTGRSCRTSSDRQVIAHDEQAARVELSLVTDHGPRTLSAALDRAGNKELKLDGTLVERTDPGFERPLVTVFLPDRLILINGTPGGRRAHLDQFSSAFTPSTAGLRNDYNRALVQRNALVSRVRAGGQVGSSIDAWDAELARTGTRLAAARDDAVAAISESTATIASELGLRGTLEVAHRPGCELSEAAFIERLLEDRAGDIERGYTHHGPHRGDLLVRREGRDIKQHASQGEKRIALLSILLAEREAMGRARGKAPLLLLDDVMSELDSTRREMLVRRVSSAGQCLITATEFDHVPDVAPEGMLKVSLSGEPDSNLRAA